MIINKTYLLISIQIIAIALLIYKLSLRPSSPFAHFNTVPVDQKDTKKTSLSSLQYYTEPIANSTIDKLNDWTPYKAVYTINSDTLNEQKNYEIKKPTNTFRIITLGDSFTYGLYVNTTLNWTEQLESALNKKTCKAAQTFEVINLGMYGYDIQYSTERYKIRGQKYTPDLVLWLLHEDDYTLVNELLLAKEKYYNKKLHDSQEFETLVKQGHLYPSWDMAVKEYEKETDKTVLHTLQRTYLDNFATLYKNDLVVINFASENRDIKTFFSTFTKTRENIYHFDELVDIYKDSDNYFANDGHPTIQGHTLIAKDLEEYLIEKQLLPCIPMVEPTN